MKSEKENQETNNFNQQVDELQKQWKQLSKQHIIDAISKAGPDEKAIHDYLQAKAESAE